MNIVNLTLHETIKLLEDGSLTSTQLVEQLIARIEEVESQIKALVSFDKETALNEARKADERRANNALLSPYDGLVIGIKDNIVEEGKEARCSSTILDNLVHFYDAHVVKRLKEHGCIILGRANMDEFAMGSSTETSQVKQTCNPYNLTCVPGGSSGGSAAGVAAGEFLACLGSDTGGSIRQPASFCGVVGLKPTYGLVSRFGLIAFASSLDQIGPLTKDVEDSAIMLDLLAGYDPLDSTSIKQEEQQYFNNLKQCDLSKITIGVIKEYLNIDGIKDDVKAKVQEAINLLKSLGAKIVEVALPHTKYSIPTYYVLATAEASTNLARFDGIRYGNRKQEQDSSIHDVYQNTRAAGFGEEVQRRIMLGTYVLSSYEEHKYYHKAEKVRKLINDDFTKAFEQCDILISPVSPETAFKFNSTQDPVTMYLADIFTTAVNLAGISAISVPCGFDKTNLPIGLQFITPALQEQLLLNMAYTYEKNANFEKFEVQL